MGKDKNIEFDENKDRRIKYCQNASEGDCRPRCRAIRICAR